jgi:transposase-like protein
MAQHFLLSSAAKSLSLATVARMSEEEAWDAFRRIRWADTDGQPVCGRCGCLDSYTYRTRKVFRCKGCSHQFTVTSGSIFASRKMPMRDYLLAIAIFVNGAKGHSALQLMENEHALNALLRKRAELTGLFEHHQAVARQTLIDIDNLDATRR